MNTETMQRAATIAELKKAYRKLAFENHPDRGGSEENMKEINRVFKIRFDILKTKTPSEHDNEDYANATATEYTAHVYNEYRWKGSRYDMNLSRSEICKKIKEYAEERFPTCKFSVNKDGYRAVNISLMQGDFEAYAEDNTDKYRQYNHYHYEINNHLTPRCNEVLRLVSEYAQSFNYDNSDIMTDYFDVNFYLSVQVGKWNKAYVNTSKVVAGEKLAKTETEKRVQKALGAGNWVFLTTRARKEGHYVCERGDSPYPRYYSQYSVIKAKLEKMRAAGLDAEWCGTGIKVNNWGDIEKQIEKERKETEAAKKEAPAKKAPAGKETEAPVQAAECGGVRIIDYTEKSIVVVGDTKPIRATLKAAGGKFNAKLSCGCGWVFSKKRKSEVEGILGTALAV